MAMEDTYIDALNNGIDHGVVARFTNLTAGIFAEVRESKRGGYDLFVGDTEEPEADFGLTWFRLKENAVFAAQKAVE